MNAQEFAKKLIELRTLAGLSIADAAKAAGVSSRTWSYWEAGERLPPSEKEAVTQERVIRKLAL